MGNRGGIKREMSGKGRQGGKNCMCKSPEARKHTASHMVCCKNKLQKFAGERGNGGQGSSYRAEFQAKMLGWGMGVRSLSRGRPWSSFSMERSL